MLKVKGHRLLIKPDPPKDQVKIGVELKAMGFEVGMWRCLVVLAALTIFLRLLSMIFLKLLVSKF